MIDLNEVRNHIVSRLTRELPVSFTYHNLDHTLDVENQSMVIAKGEGVINDLPLLELRAAALYHDIGFIDTYKGHEEVSCEIARNELPRFGFRKKTVEKICQIILSTKVPQAPKNLLQQIICDADLDYLGRDDYFVVNEKLHKEFLEFKIIEDEQKWEISRIEFLRSHNYFTKYSQQNRNQKKLEHLNYLQNITQPSA